MKKLVIALSVLFALAFSGCKAKDSNTFVLGLDASFPPLGFTEADGTIVGYDIDLAQEVCNRLGLKFVAKPIDWDSKEMELSSGSIDCIWNGFTITQKRIEELNFTPAYLNNAQVLIVRKDSGINSLEDAKLKNITVACQEGSSAEDAIKHNEAFAASLKNIVYYEENLTALTDVKLGSVDGVVMDSVVADYNISHSNDDLIVINEQLSKESYGIGFAKTKEGEKLREKVWKTLQEMDADGTIEEISNKWFGQNLSVIGK